MTNTAHIIVRRIPVCEEYQPNCSNWVKSIKLGRILVKTLMEIFRYGIWPSSSS